MLLTIGQPAERHRSIPRQLAPIGVCPVAEGRGADISVGGMTMRCSPGFRREELSARTDPDLEGRS